MNRKHMYGLLAVLLVLPAAACDSAGPGDNAAVSMSFAAPAGISNTSTLVQVGDPLTAGGPTLILQNIDVVFDEIVLERAEHDEGGDSDGESDADSDSDGSANEKLRRGPFTVSLPVNGGVVTPINESLPAGSYEKVEMDVTSVRVRGTYDGQAFDVTLPVNTELELEFENDFVVDDDADRLNVTIAIDFASWFRNSTGSVIDPRATATDSSLRAEVVNRIRSSFKAFEDSDKDADDEDSDSDD